MKITRENLKNIVRESMVEESAYQAFFKKALEKTGKSIPAMSDEEKKAFFNKIDSAWKGKGEKNEGNAFGAAVSQAKKDGDDSFKVDGEEYKVETTGKGPRINSDEEKANERFGRGAGVGPTFGSADEPEEELDEEAAMFHRRTQSGTIVSKLKEEIKVGSSVTVNYPTLKQPVKGKVKHILKSPTGLVYVLDGDKGVWDAKNVSESVNEGIGTIALGVAGGLLLLKLLKFVVKKTVGAVGMTVTLPKEKLLEVVETVIKNALTQSSGKNVNMFEIVALRSFLKDEINAGKITRIKQIIQVIDKVSKNVSESVNEVQSPSLKKALTAIGWWGEDWTPREFAKQIKNLSDSTLTIWYDDAKKNKGIPNTPLAFQQKLTKTEMEKRGLIESTNKSVNEGRYDADLDKIEAAVKNASSFMNVGSELKKIGVKYDFSTSMIPMYRIKVSGNTIVIVNKKHAAGAEREVKDIAIGLMEHVIKESTNERMGSDKGEVGNANFNNRLKAMRDDKNSFVAFIDTNKGKKLLKVFKTQQTAKQFTNKNMDTLLNTKGVESVGTMSKKEWDAKEAKYAIESVNEAKVYTPKQVKQALEKLVKQLKVKWKQKGGYEDFGQTELRKFKDTFGYSPYGSSDERKITDLIDSFEDWAMDYSG
jgi:hypothetical protein